MKKNFFYRINPCEVLAETVFADNREQWFLQFFNDLKNDSVDGAKLDISKRIISEAHAFREKRSVAGKASAQQRSTYVKHKATKVKQRSTSSSSSTEEETKKQYAEHVTMSEDDHQKLVNEHGQGKTDWMIQKLNTYKGSNGKKYKNDYLAILSWVVDKADKEYVENRPKVFSMQGY